MALKDILDELYADDARSFAPYREGHRRAVDADRAAAIRPLLAQGGGPVAAPVGPGLRGSDLVAQGQQQAARAAMYGAGVAGIEGAGRLQAQDDLARYRRQRQVARAAYEQAMAQGLSDVIAGHVAGGYRLLSDPGVRSAMDKPRRDAEEARALMDLWGKV